MDLTHVNRRGTSTNRDRNNSLRSRKDLSSKLYSQKMIVWIADLAVEIH